MTGSCLTEKNPKINRDGPIIFRPKYCDFFFLKGCCFSVTHLANVSIEVDGVDRGIRSLKLESPLGELEQLLKTVLEPVEFMCQV